MATALSFRAPTDTRTVRWAMAAWLAFVCVQVLDGAMSYVGVQTHGHWIEGNPIVAWYAGALGPAVAFTAVKLFAVACGTILYLTARHHWVVLLTAGYVVFAIVPWIRVLTGAGL
jgi:hypothetical protein